MVLRRLRLSAALALLPTIAWAEAPPSAPKPPPPQQTQAQPKPTPQTQAIAAPVDQNGARSGSVTPLATTGMKAETFKTVDGKSGWRVQIPGGRALATPAVVDDTIYVGGGFGSHEFYAFDAKSGAPRWAITVSDDGPTAAVVSGGRVIFNTESCTLFVVDAKTGKMIWSRWLGDPLMSQPAVSGGVVYMAFPGAGGHQLIALKLEDGKQLWQAPIAGDIISAPVIDGDSIYLSTNDGTVYRHKLSNGQLDWKKELHATSAPWVAADGVHVSQGEALNGHGKQEGFRTLASDGRVTTGLQGGRDATWLDANQNAQSGYATKQKADDSSVGFSSAPATAQTAEASANLGQATVRGLWEFQGSRPLIVDTHNYNTQGDRVRALDGDGILLWEKKLAGDLKAAGGALGAPPSYAGGKLVVATTTGDITGYEAASGKELFRYPLGQEIRFQPALVKGRIVIGSATGVLTSIDTTDASLDKWTMWGGGPKHNGPE